MLALLVQPQYATDAFPSPPNISNITSLPVNPNAPLTSTVLPRNCNSDRMSQCKCWYYRLPDSKMTSSLVLQSDTQLI